MRAASVAAAILLVSFAGCSKRDEPCATCARPTRSNVHLAPSPRGPVRVTSDITPPLLVRRVEPSFPDEVKKGSHQPFVAFEATIDAEGNVTDVRPVGPSDPVVLPYVLEAVKQWKFRPAERRGEPVPVIYDMTLTFQIR
jgi:protein TonB